MKNVLLFLFVLLSYFTYSQSCLHTIQRTDTWGDGWNGGAVSVSVNGVTVLSNLSCAGYGPTSSVFSAAVGATIRVFRTFAGSYPSEMRIRVLNGAGATIINTIQPLAGTATSGGHIVAASCAGAVGPCINTTAYGSATAPSTPTTVIISTCQFQSEFSPIYSCIAGRTYQSAYNLGGFITVRSGTYNGTVVASGSTPLNWVCPSSGTYFVHYNTNNTCGTATNCGTSYITCLTCAAPAVPGPCINTTAYGLQTLPVFGGISYTTVPCQFAGEYSTWSGAVSGTPYIAMTTVATDWITVRSGAYNGAVVAVGLGPLSFTPTTNNTLYIHVNTNSLCGTANSCRNVSVTRISALPVELISFTGKKQTNSNMLYWSTASEYNTSHFIIEKSEDGFEWSDIGQLQSAGNSTQQLDYSFEDKDVSQVINYYRLRQYDIDGADDVYGPIAINNRDRINIIAKRINLAGQEVNENATGIIIEIYEDGTIKRIIK
jgi:hypothetical protein